MCHGKGVSLVDHSVVIVIVVVVDVYVVVVIVIVIVEKQRIVRRDMRGMSL
jgi:hypothetical protein